MINDLNVTSTILISGLASQAANAVSLPVGRDAMLMIKMMICMAIMIKLSMIILISNSPSGLASQAANAVSLPNRINWLSEEEGDQDQEHVR